MLDCNTDLDIENFIRGGTIDGIDSEVIFEQEVADTFMKELKIKRKLVDLERDFKWPKD